MLNQRGLSPILLVLIVVLVCGLVVGGFYILKPQQTAQSSQPQFSSSAPSSLPLPSFTPVDSPLASPSATLTPVENTVHITFADSLQTVNVTVGSTLLLDYKSSGYDWTDDFDSGYIQPISSSQVKVIKAGTTVLKSEGRPHCSPGEMCPMHILEFSVTLVAS